MSYTVYLPPSWRPLQVNRLQSRIYAATLLAGASAIGASVALKYGALGRPLRIFIALVPAAFYIALFAVLLGAVRQLDQFQQRIALEATTFAALATGLVALVYGQLEKAGELPSMNVGLMVAVLMVFYAVGHLVALRRYR